jgi:hypothetical protein
MSANGPRSFLDFGQLATQAHYLGSSILLQ